MPPYALSSPLPFHHIPYPPLLTSAQLYAKPSQGDTLEKILRILKGLTTREPGVLDYVISRDNDERDTFHVFERYTGRKAFEEHIASQGVSGSYEFGDFSRATEAEDVEAVAAIVDTGTTLKVIGVLSVRVLALMPLLKLLKSRVT
jgi:quinol monooxygenase YgiN